MSARRVLMPLVLGASLGWLLWLLAGAWPLFVQGMRGASWPHIGLGALFVVAAMYASFLAFRPLMAGLAELPLSRAGHLYFTAQLMRHLPGRFFGFAYQIASTRGAIPASAWVAANAAHMLVNLWLGVLVGAGVLLWPASRAAGVAVVVGGVAASWLGWELLCRQRARLELRPAWRIGAWLIAALRFLAGVRRRERTAVIGILLASWQLYFVAWACFGAAYPTLTAGDGLVLCAWYSAAWLIGYASFLTPSGLGVRELAFAGLAATYAPETIAYAAVLGRLVLLFGDLILGLVFLPFHERIRPSPGL